MAQSKPDFFDMRTGMYGTYVDSLESDTGREDRVDIVWIPIMGSGKPDGYGKQRIANVNRMDIIRVHRPGVKKGNSELVILLKNPDEQSSLIIDKLDKHYENLSENYTSLKTKANHKISRAGMKERWIKKQQEIKTKDENHKDSDNVADSIRRRRIS